MMKRQTIDWKKIFAKHVSGKGLVCKIYKYILQFERRQTT